jgi:hypothetical protein
MISPWGWNIGETLTNLLLPFAIWVTTSFKPENCTMSGGKWLKTGTKWKDGARVKWKGIQEEMQLYCSSERFIVRKHSSQLHLSYLIMTNG